MGARTYGVIVAAVVATAAGWWAWSQHCETYGLCSPACRVASNGVEYWKTVSPVTATSRWIRAKASPGSECLLLLELIQKQHVGRRVAIKYIDLANERKLAPFYQYDCTFDIKEPVFALARNPECSVRLHKP